MKLWTPSASSVPTPPPPPTDPAAAGVAAPVDLRFLFECRTQRTWTRTWMRTCECECECKCVSITLPIMKSSDKKKFGGGPFDLPLVSLMRKPGARDDRRLTLRRLDRHVNANQLNQTPSPPPPPVLCCVSSLLVYVRSVPSLSWQKQRFCVHFDDGGGVSRFHGFTYLHAS